MASYDVIPAPRHAVASSGLVIGMVAAFLLTAVAAPALTAVTVTVDGTVVRLPTGATARTVLESGVVAAEPGDIIDVTGAPIAPGAGGPVTITRGDATLSPGDRVFDGDVLASRPGADRMEPVVMVATETPVPLRYEGEGPLEEVSALGRPGLALNVVGAISGRIASSRTLTEPVPTVIVRRSPRRSDKVVALTFDDGPWPGQTERILDILARDDVKVTFFMIGSSAKRHPGLAKRVAEEGHAIGNHSYSHRNLALADRRVVDRELSLGQQALRRAVGVTPRWFRPPGGHMSSEAAKAARSEGMRVVTWSVDPQDWRRPKAGVLARAVLAEVKPGSVILLHDGGGDRSATVRALPWIIHGLQEKGYRFVTLDELR